MVSLQLQLRLPAIMLAVLASVPGCLSGSPKHILFLMIDDLGSYDSQVNNPDAPGDTIGALVKEGIKLEVEMPSHIKIPTCLMFSYAQIHILYKMYKCAHPIEDFISHAHHHHHHCSAFMPTCTVAPHGARFFPVASPLRSIQTKPRTAQIICH